MAQDLGDADAPIDDASAVEDVLASRLAELDSAEVVPFQQSEEETTAIPLRRVERQTSNPGRR
jgi:hypothetical protein